MRGLVASLRRLAWQCRGGAAIEFAIIVPTLFALFLGIVEFGRLYYVRQSLEYATEQAARYYMLNPTYASSAITTYLQGQMAGGMGSNVSVSYVDTTSCNSNSKVTCTTISTSYTFTFVAQYLGFSSTTLATSAQAVRY